MGHFVVSVSQFQLKCLTAARGLPLEIFSTNSLLPFLLDKSCEHNNPKSRQVLWPDPTANGKLESSMENQWLVSPSSLVYINEMK